MSADYQQPQIRSFTGMRFLAATAVFIWHALVIFPVAVRGRLPYGGAGVSFFFVLSGFILTYVYGRRGKETFGTTSWSDFGFRKFYFKRFARIWPLHIATLLLYLFLIQGVGRFFSNEHATAKLLANASLLQCWVPKKEWVFAFNGVSWSLSVEAFFYLMFPLLLIGGPKRFVYKYVGIVFATIAGAVLVYIYTGDQFTLNPAAEGLAINRIFQAIPLSRLLEFATGVGCGFLYLSFPPIETRRKKWRDSVFEIVTFVVVGAFFICSERAGLYSVSMTDQFPTFAYWYRFSGSFPVFALLLLVFSRTRGLLTELLSTPWMVYLGEISFSFYMIHPFVLSRIRQIDLSRELSAFWACCALSFFGSMLAASALYHLVELPCRKLIVDAGEPQRATRFFSTFSAAISDWLQPKRFVPLLLLTLVSGVVALQYRFDDRDATKIASTIAKTPDKFIESSAIKNPDLIGFRRQAFGKREFVYDLVWRVGPGESALRFARVMDDEGKMLGNAEGSRKLQNETESEINFIDQIVIPVRKLVGVDHVDIVVRNMSPDFDIRSRGSRNQRVTIWRANLEGLPGEKKLR